MSFKYLFIIILALKSIVANGQKSNEIHIGANQNLETFAIVEQLSLRHSKIYYVLDSLIQIQPTVRPLLKRSSDYFATKANDDITFQLAKLMDTLFITKTAGRDIFMTYLLFHKPFPKQGYISPFKFSSDNLSKEQNEYIDREIHQFIENLRLFYVNNKVGDFIKDNKSFYKGAIDEIKKNIPPKVIQQLNNYYRVDNKNRYSIIVMPTRPWPKGDWSANGPSVPLKNGSKHFYNILSSYIEVPYNENNAYTSFGFDNIEWLQELCVHEFGHSYVHEDLDKLESEINKNDAILSGIYAEEMKKVSTWTWRTCVEEHIIRAIEIRIAEYQNNLNRANKLRDEYILKDKYIFIPLIEEELKKYETNQGKYPTFRNFLPKLIDLFNSFSPEQRDKLLSDK